MAENTKPQDANEPSKAQIKREVKRSSQASAAVKSGPNPGVIVTPFPPVSAATAKAQEIANQATLARNVTGGLVGLNPNYSP